MYERDKVLGMLPNPFIFDDGSKVETAADWRRKRLEILDTPLDIEFGGMPEFPKIFAWKYTGEDEGTAFYRLSFGNGLAVCDLDIELHFPADFDKNKKYPTVISGDACWRPKYWPAENIKAITDRGYICVLFDRTKLSPDNNNEGQYKGLYEVYPYPENSFKTISAWAYGYHRAVDFLLCLPYVDADFIGITGHSRGGKTVLLAGATDERIRFVNPNGSGAHGCGCWRYETYLGDDAQQWDKRNELLRDMIHNIPYWLGDKLMAYDGRETELPFDMHYFKALVAPRYFLETEAFGDTWANPAGSYETLLAAKRVYEFLGVPENIMIHYREGGHFHQIEDRMLLLDLMDAVREGKPMPAELTKTYFDGLKPIFEF